MIAILFLIQLHIAAQAQSIVSTESLELQQLIGKSEQQIRVAKELLKNAKQDAQSLEKAAQILDKLSAGINQSIEKYQGTKAYEKALLELQSHSDFGNSTGTAGSQDLRKKATEDFVKFQNESIRANASDLTNQENLAQALRSAEHGFIPKIQAQAQLGGWQANTRVSAQLTELLTAINGLREDLKNKDRSDALSELLTGSEIQNAKQREGAIHAPR